MPSGPEKPIGCENHPKSRHMFVSRAGPCSIFPCHQVTEIPQPAVAFPFHIPALTWNEWIAVSSSPVGVSTQLSWELLQFEVKAAHSAYQQRWRHCKDPAGPSGRCDPLFYLVPFWLSLLIFCFFPHLFNLAYPLLCPLDDFSSHLTSFPHVPIPVALSSLTFPSISVICYLPLTEATGLKTCSCDFWPRFCSHWLAVSVGLIATVAGFLLILLRVSDHCC